MLPRNRRITSAKDWKELHWHGRVFHTSKILVKILKNNRPQSRFGFVVGTKISKKATVRNKIKRRVRAIVQRNLNKIKNGFDVIFIIKPGPRSTDTFDEIEDEIVALLTRSRLWQ